MILKKPTTEFKIKKDKQIFLHELYEPFNQKKANDILNCGVDLWFLLKQHKSTLEKKYFLESMYTCKDRFCIFCNWRRELKYKRLTYQFLDDLQRKKRLRYIFLTLTVKNCNISDLRGTIRQMSEAFKRMKESKRFKISILGYLRALEFTIEKGTGDMMHPHFHCMIAVEQIYFSLNRDLYINQEEWVNMWQKALRVDYKPSVDIRVVEMDRKRKTRPTVIAEMIKYTMKDTDIRKVDDFEELTKQLKGIRIFNAGGILKGILKKTEEIDKDLVHINEEDQSELWTVLERVLYCYEKIIDINKFDYFLKKKQIQTTTKI
jgi:plasmid rolling circle replication initiator protein Rep